MACCCKSGRSNKSSVSCLGRCDLTRHHCVHRPTKKGPVPKHMGWLYTAKGAPEHQLRCGWRPGHIFCPVLRRIEQHNCMKMDECGLCPSVCSRPRPPCCAPPPPPPPPPPRCHATPCCSATRCKPLATGQALIRIVRHEGKYTICTMPEDVCNAPSSDYPLKYVLDTKDPAPENTKFSIEAKFNEYHFDYTSSQGSFVLDFSPPESPCRKACPTAESDTEPEPEPKGSKENIKKKSK